MAYTRRNTNKDATWARAWTADVYSDLTSIAAISGSEGPRHGDIAYVTDIGVYFLWLDNNTWAPLYLTIPAPPILFGEECNHEEQIFPASLDAIAGETLRRIVQENITRTGTLVGGATGSGFTVALSISTITGTLADARLSTNVPLLNAANTFTGANVFDQVAQTFKANSSGDAIKIVGRSAGSNFGNFKFFDNDGTTQRGYVQSSSVGGGQINFVANQKFTLEASSGVCQIYASSGLEIYPDASTLRAVISSAGAWTWSAYGAGTLTTDASGNITAVSDERLKNVQGNYTGGLKEILAITPIKYKYIYGSGLDTYNTYVGFSAKAVESYIPEAVGENAEGKLSFSDRPIIATLVNAVKELQDQIDTLKAALNLTPFDRTITPKTSGKIRRMV